MPKAPSEGPERTSAGGSTTTLPTLTAPYLSLELEDSRRATSLLEVTAIPAYVHDPSPSCASILRARAIVYCRLCTSQRVYFRINRYQLAVRREISLRVLIGR